MNALVFIGFALASFAISRLILPAILAMLTEAGFVRPNFRRENIPLGVGLILFLAVLIVIGTARALNVVDNSAYTFLFAVGGMGLFGLIDDVFGTRGASGLKGHFKKLVVQRELTTGALKALAGGMIALLVSLSLPRDNGILGWAVVLMNLMIMALSTNAINLLDLRPGRAGKGFLVITAFIIITGNNSTTVWYLAAVAGSLAALLPYDLRAQVMMGDTGSNLLGMATGFAAVFALGLPAKLIYLVFLVGFHLFTEKYSLTKVIEKNRILNYLDMLGRE